MKKLIPILFLILVLSNSGNAQWFALNQNPSGGDTEFITEWDMLAASFTFPLRSGYGYDMTIDWGDGSPLSTVTSFSDTDKTHIYGSSGTYQIIIDGTCEAIYIDNIAAVDQLITKVIQWGHVGFTSFHSSFEGTTNLTSLPDGPITGATAVDQFSFCWQNSGLPTIPIGIFDETLLVIGYAYTFRYTPVTVVPDGLIDNNIATDVTCYSMFRDTDITSIALDFASGVDVSIFDYAFAGNPQINTEVPELWNTHTPSSSLRCFYQDVNATNYADIPSGWK